MRNRRTFLDVVNPSQHAQTAVVEDCQFLRQFLLRNDERSSHLGFLKSNNYLDDLHLKNKLGIAMHQAGPGCLVTVMAVQAGHRQLDAAEPRMFMYSIL